LRVALIAVGSAIVAGLLIAGVMLVWAGDREDDARAEGFAEGLAAGDRDGYDRGYEAGYYDGREAGYDDAFQVGYTTGVNDAYEVESLGGFLADIEISGQDTVTRGECTLRVYSEEERAEVGSQVHIGCY
jgi:hypothetical protein